MKKNNRLIQLFFIVIATIALWQMARTGGEGGEIITESKGGVHQMKFFDDRIFYKSLRKISVPLAKPVKEIKGGIAPHHFPAAEMIAGFYSYFQNQNIKTVIIIGPNHNEVGNFPALSGLSDWDTPFGKVESEKIIVNDLVGGKLAEINEMALENEHSIALHMPFVKYFLPKAKIAPIILSGKMGIEEAEKLSIVLEKYAKKKETIIVASVDFSHYLPEAASFEKDKETLEAIKKFDFKKLRGFGSGNLDSPPAIIVLLSVIQRIGGLDLKVINNLNSEYFIKSGRKETTSYITALFY